MRSYVPRASRLDARWSNVKYNDYFLVFCQFICIPSCPLDAVHLMVENFR